MKRKGWVLSVLFLVGTLVAVTVFAQASHDNEEHQKSRTHIHWFTDHSPEREVQWTVEVGKMDWNGLSTYIWHKIYVIKKTDGSVTGDWEWNHEVTIQGTHHAWNDNDTRFGHVTWNADTEA